MKLLFLAALLTLAAAGFKTPHLATDVIAGDLVHANTHLSAKYTITRMWYGDRVKATMEDAVKNFKGCKYVKFAPSKYYPKDAKALIFNCGESFNEVLETGGLLNGIAKLHFYSEAVAMPGPPPSEKH